VIYFVEMECSCLSVTIVELSGIELRVRHYDSLM
jgi:hypothetical protein